MTDKMPIRARRRAITSGLLMIMMAAGSPLLADDEVPQVTHDGLHLVPDTQVAIAWVKPDAGFSGYDKFMILDVYVAFRKNWARDQSRGSIHRVSQRDVERMKQDMAKLFREVFIEELDEKGGYPVVDSPDAGVLLLRPAIIDLEVTAPDLDTPGRSYKFASSAGAATLYLEVYDSVSGEILARVLDRKTARHAGDFMRWTNKMTNRAEGRRVLAGWAGLLRARFDELHGRETD